MKKHLVPLFLIACSVISSSSAAERLLIDFGLNDETTTGPDLNGRYWNNFQMTSSQLNQTPTIAAGSVLNRDGTTASGVSLAITDGFDKASTNTSGTEEIYTANATSDFFYVDLDDSNTVAKVKIAGLDTSGATVYDFKFLVTSNRSLPQVFITDFTATGATTSATVSLEAIGNSNTVASINGMTPDGSGEIEVMVEKNAGSDRFGAISVMEVVGRAQGDPVTPDPSPYTLSVAPGEWTIALIPDTQYYTRSHPAIFDAQTDWLRDHQREYNIRFALHVGDITDDNVADQWERARDAMTNLDGHMPYFFVPGNHDYGVNGNASTRDTLMNDYFKYSDYSTRPHFGGAKDVGKMDNTYHTISAGGYDWIIMCLEWGPTDATIAWADGVLTAHPNHKAILVTHAYMYYDNTRYDHTGPNQSWNPHGDYSTPGNPNDGQELWDKLVKKHDFMLTVNGHVLGDGTGFLTSANLAGKNVHQMLANYQSGVADVGPITTNLSGNGYLRLLTIKTDGTVQVKTYSPVFNNWNTDADQEFTFSIADWYSPADTNANSVADFYDEALDSDSDGLNNYDEFMIYGTAIDNTDSDGDDIADGLEVSIGTNPAVSDLSAKTAILDNADDFGYYNEQGIIDLNVGKLMITPNGANFDLNLQLQTTQDLGNIPFADHGAPIPWSIIGAPNKYFMRVRAEP